MPHTGIIESFFYIFAGAAVLATAALYTRQPMLVAYILLGALLGPFGLSWVDDPALLSEISEFGIIFLLFLVGLDLQPSKLKNMVGASLLTAIGTTIVFFGLGFGVMYVFEFNLVECAITGLAAAFSSTILGIKLLPTTVLHHKHVGELVVSLLLIQDLLAILAILLLNGLGARTDVLVTSVLSIGLGLPLLCGLAYLGVRFMLLPLVHVFDAFHEYIFLIAIGWCLALANIASTLGLSVEIGAFIAGVSLATSPIAQYIAQNLRPLRDFFLVLFFFSVGAGLNLDLITSIWLPALLLAVLLIALKPMVFAGLLHIKGENSQVAWEVGYRLGQASEFSLLLSYIALSTVLIGERAALVIQFSTVLTLVLSSYFVIFRYPNPIAPNPNLRRD
ncbi:MAG: cation:proton antiporter [Gammaproteobacteria bacterium]|jgi:Kef-type K+ transport system membrane component KefB|nr:cation:proton antiporter [Gammaproteobacteria bacterium]